MRCSIFFFLLLVPGFIGAEDKPEKLPEILKPWQGSWDVTHSTAVSWTEFVVAERLGLGGKEVVVTVKGNQLFVGDKLIATLTTDFSDSTLDVEKKVQFSRKPVMFTLVNGKGIRCSYEFIEDQIAIRHPYTSGHMSTVSSFLLKLHK